MSHNFDIEGSLNLDTEKAKKGIVEVDTAVEALSLNTKKFVAGFDEGLKKDNDSVNKVGKSLGELSRKLQDAGGLSAKLGKALETGMGTHAAGGIMKAAASFMALQAAAGPILVIIGAIIAAIKLIGGVIGKAVEEQKKFTENVKSAKTALDGVKEAVSDIEGASENSAQGMSGMEKAGTAISIIFQKLGEWFENTFKPIIEGLLVPFNAIGNGIAWIADKLGLATGEEVKLAHEAQAVAEQTANISSATDKYNKQLKTINQNLSLGRITQKEAEEQKLSAQNSYLDALLEERNAIAAINGDNSLIVQSLDTQIQQLSQVTGLMNEQQKEKTKGLTKEQQFIADRNKLTELYNNKLKVINASGENQLIINDKLQQLHREQITALENLVQQYGYVRSEAKIAYGLMDDIRLLVKDQTEEEKGLNKITSATKQLEEDRLKLNKKLAEGAITYEQYLEEQNVLAKQYNETLEDIKVKYDMFPTVVDTATAALIDQQKREQEGLNKIADASIKLAEDKEALEFKRRNGLITEKKYLEEQNNLSGKYNDTISNIAGEYADIPAVINAATSALQKHEQKAKTTLEVVSGAVKNVAAVSETVGQIGENILAVTAAMADDQIATIEKNLEKMREAIDEEFNRSMSLYEEQRQAALEAAGFVAATTEEGLEAAMAAAIESGDNAVIYREQRRQEELAINKKYNDLEKEAQDQKDKDTKAAEKKAAQETADIQYQQAMAEWILKVTQAPAQIAQGILQGYATLGPVLGTGAAVLMGALGATQIAALVAAMPKKPVVAFRDGAAFAGAVVDKPIKFNFAQGGEFRTGLMGEAGAEAIMPLKRMDDGALGVNAAVEGKAEQAVYTITADELANYVIQCVNNGGTDKIQLMRIDR